MIIINRARYNVSGFVLHYCDFMRDVVVTVACLSTPRHAFSVRNDKLHSM